MILGKGWVKHEIDPHRTARIIGFDQQCAQKGDCPMGTGVTVMEDSKGSQLLVIAHQAIFNEGSTTTLLSEFQMRGNGLIVDSVSRKHKGQDGSPGTQ